MTQRTTPIEKQFDKKGPKVVEALKRRHFDAYYCPTGEEALKKVLSLILFFFCLTNYIKGLSFFLFRNHFTLLEVYKICQMQENMNLVVIMIY